MAKISNPLNRSATRVAGLTYILVILIGILKVNYIEPTFVPQSGEEVGATIFQNELLFRIGVACELLMYILVLVLSIALYIIVKPVGKNLGLSALFFRSGEAIIGTASVILSGLIPLLLLHKFPLEQETLEMLVNVFMESRKSALDVVLTFIGVGGTVYCYLFFISRLVPRVLAAWGILTYVSMFMLGFLNMLFPERPNSIETILFSTGALFEIVFGLWLLIKGTRSFDESKVIA